MSCWEEVQVMLEESRLAAEQISDLETKLKESLEINENLINVIEQKNKRIENLNRQAENALQSSEKADKLLRRAEAKIAMLNARIEHGSGADKLVLCDALYLMFDAARRGLVPFTDKHLAEVRKAARG